MKTPISGHQRIAKNILVTLYNNSPDTTVSELSERFGMTRTALHWALLKGNFPNPLRAYQILKKAPLLAENVHTDREYVRKYRNAKAGE